LRQIQARGFRAVPNISLKSVFTLVWAGRILISQVIDKAIETRAQKKDQVYN
jgi:hypothetical protein